MTYISTHLTMLRQNGPRYLTTLSFFWSGTWRNPRESYFADHQKQDREARATTAKSSEFCDFQRGCAKTKNSKPASLNET